MPAPEFTTLPVLTNTVSDVTSYPTNYTNLLNVIDKMYLEVGFQKSSINTIINRINTITGAATAVAAPTDTYNQYLVKFKEAIENLGVVPNNMIRPSAFTSVNMSNATAGFSVSDDDPAVFTAYSSLDSYSIVDGTIRSNSIISLEDSHFQPNSVPVAYIANQSQYDGITLSFASAYSGYINGNKITEDTLDIGNIKIKPVHLDVGLNNNSFNLDRREETITYNYDIDGILDVTKLYMTNEMLSLTNVDTFFLFSIDENSEHSIMYVTQDEVNKLIKINNSTGQIEATRSGVSPSVAVCISSEHNKIVSVTESHIIIFDSNLSDSNIQLYVHNIPTDHGILCTQLSYTSIFIVCKNYIREISTSDGSVVQDINLIETCDLAGITNDCNIVVTKAESVSNKLRIYYRQVDNSFLTNEYNNISTGEPIHNIILSPKGGTLLAYATNNEILQFNKIPYTYSFFGKSLVYGYFSETGDNAIALFRYNGSTTLSMYKASNKSVYINNNMKIKSLISDIGITSSSGYFPPIQVVNAPNSIRKMSVCPDLPQVIHGSNIIYVNGYDMSCPTLIIPSKDVNKLTVITELTYSYTYDLPISEWKTGASFFDGRYIVLYPTGVTKTDLSSELTSSSDFVYMRIDTTVVDFSSSTTFNNTINAALSYVTLNLDNGNVADDILIYTYKATINSRTSNVCIYYDSQLVWISVLSGSSLNISYRYDNKLSTLLYVSTSINTIYNGSIYDILYTDDNNIARISAEQAIDGDYSIKIPVSSSNGALCFLNTDNTFELSGEFTIELWAYVVPDSSSQYLVHFSDINTFFSNLCYIMINNAGYLVVYVGPSYSYSTYNFNEKMNTWAHIAITRDSSNNVKTFVNGQIAYNSVVTGPISGTSKIFANIALGGAWKDSHSQPANRLKNGYLDKVRVLNKCLYTDTFSASAYYEISTPLSAPPVNVDMITNAGGSYTMDYIVIDNILYRTDEFIANLYELTGISGWGSICSDGRYVYIANSTSNHIIRLDANNYSKLSNVIRGFTNSSIAGFSGICTDGIYLYASPNPANPINPDRQDILVVDMNKFDVSRYGNSNYYFIQGYSNTTYSGISLHDDFLVCTPKNSNKLVYVYTKFGGNY
jgi:hypothetical protein